MSKWKRGKLKLEAEYSRKATEMSGTVREAVNLLEILPEQEQDFALEFIKKLVLAWDPDFTKVTPLERRELEEAEKDMQENGTVPHDAIKWD